MMQGATGSGKGVNPISVKTEPPSSEDEGQNQKVKYAAGVNYVASDNDVFFRSEKKSSYPFRYRVSKLPASDSLPSVQERGLVKGTDKTNLTKLQALLKPENREQLKNFMRGKHDLYNWVVTKNRQIEKWSGLRDKNKCQWAQEMAAALDKVCETSDFSWRNMAPTLNYLEDYTEAKSKQLFQGNKVEETEQNGLGDFIPPWTEKTYKGSSLAMVNYLYWEVRQNFGNSNRLKEEGGKTVPIEFSREDMCALFYNLADWLVEFGEEVRFDQHGLSQLEVEAFEDFLDISDREANAVEGQPKWTWRGLKEVLENEGYEVCKEHNEYLEGFRFADLESLPDESVVGSVSETDSMHDESVSEVVDAGLTRQQSSDSGTDDDLEKEGLSLVVSLDTSSQGGSEKDSASIDSSIISSTKEAVAAVSPEKSDESEKVKAKLKTKKRGRATAGGKARKKAKADSPKEESVDDLRVSYSLFHVRGRQYFGLRAAEPPQRTHRVGFDSDDSEGSERFGLGFPLRDGMWVDDEVELSSTDSMSLGVASDLEDMDIEPYEFLVSKDCLLRAGVKEEEAQDLIVTGDQVVEFATDVLKSVLALTAPEDELDRGEAANRAEAKKRLNQFILAQESDLRKRAAELSMAGLDQKDGGGHSVFLSKQIEFADILIEAAEKMMSSIEGAPLNGTDRALKVLVEEAWMVRERVSAAIEILSALEDRINSSFRGSVGLASPEALAALTELSRLKNAAVMQLALMLQDSVNLDDEGDELLLLETVIKHPLSYTRSLLSHKQSDEWVSGDYGVSVPSRFIRSLDISLEGLRHEGKKESVLMQASDVRRIIGEKLVDIHKRCKSKTAIWMDDKEKVALRELAELVELLAQSEWRKGVGGMYAETYQRHLAELSEAVKKSADSLRGAEHDEAMSELKSTITLFRAAASRF